MTKVHMLDDAVVHVSKAEMEGATPIRPMRAVVMQFPVPRTSDEWAIPPAPLSLAVRPEFARESVLF